MGFFLLSNGAVASHPLVYAIDASYPVGYADASYPVGYADAAPVKAPKALTLPGYPVTLTAYNAVPEQTDNSPFETASGAYSNPEIVAARSQDLAKELPFGTIIEIDGTDASKKTCGYDIVAPIIGYRVIADTMNARYTDRIDILFSTESNYARKNGGMKNAGMILGICTGITVRVVGHVAINHIPKTQMELAKIVNSDDNALALK
jgi:3D (Asp-Asp-Asp) domain-containing protein